MIVPPRLMRTLKGAARRARRLAGGAGIDGGPGHDVAAPSGGLAAYETILRERRSTAYGIPFDQVHFPLRPPTGLRDDRGWPLPPLALAQRIGALTLEDFAAVGLETKQTIGRCLPQDFDWRGARVLDFGCGVGRVLRAFHDEADSAEFWGCDIDGPSIRWCVENLSPPFRFFQLSEVPTIPLEDASFDLVYAISVFAHIHVDWHQWLMEVRRILRPGGYAFVSFMAQTPFEEMLGHSYQDYGPDFGKLVRNPFADWNAGGPMAFHSTGWLQAFWGSLFDIDLIALDGLLDYQSICLMRKPDRGPPRTGSAAVLKTGTQQRFDIDAVGRIYPRPDLDRPLRDSYGLDGSGAIEVAGWIVFRGDRPAGMTVLIDGAAVDASVEFEPDSPYRDWGVESIQTAFAIRMDLSATAPGEHRLAAHIRSAGGKTHELSISLTVRPTHAA